MNELHLKGVLIGAGYFAGFQAEAWRRMAGAELAAVVDALPGKAREFAERFSVPRAYESVDEALQRERPDFVDIATRPESHLSLTRNAAQRGMHGRTISASFFVTCKHSITCGTNKIGSQVRCSN